MKLTSLIENSKKDYKDRNPVAKELRQNPLYKAKTETDKKKEVKKGYQKHKGKIEEDKGPSDMGMNKYGLSATKMGDEWKSYRHGKLTGTFKSQEELAKHQQELIKNEATIKPYVSMYTGDDGKMIYDVLDANGKSAYQSDDKQDAFDFLKDNYKRLLIPRPTSEAEVGDLGSMNDKMKGVLSKVRDQDTDDQKADAERKEQEREAKAKELGDAGMQDYVQKLKSHDWTYEYSDDHRYWQKGSAERDELHRLADILDPDHKIWNKYDPFARKNEASGYEGQSEPTSHTFNGVDVDAVSTAIKKAGVSAYAEKTPDGVKVHTYDHDRQSVAKTLGIEESMMNPDGTPNYGDESRDIATELWAEMPNFEKEKFGGNNEEGFENFLKSDDFSDHLDHLRSKFEDKEKPEPELSVDDMADEDLPAFLRQYKKKTAEIDRMKNLAGMSTASHTDLDEDYQKMVRELVIKLIKKGMSDDEIQARTGEAGERIKIIRQNAEEEMNEYDGPDETIDGSFTDKQIKQAFGVLNDPRFKQGNYDGAVEVINKIAPGLADHPSVANALKRANEATQDLVKAINPLKSIAKTTMSPQMTAKGIDAISQGERPSPQQIKAIEPYMSSIAKAIQNPQTATQMRNIIKKVN